MSERVTQAEFARRIADRMGRTVARSTVKRWADAGKIVSSDDGLVDLTASLKRLDALGVGQLRPDVTLRHRSEAADKGAQRTQHADATAARHVGHAGPEQADAAAGRRRHKETALYFDNQLIRLDMALEAGNRYIKRDVRQEGFALGATLRSELERVIDQSAPLLAITTDDAERCKIITAALKRVRGVVRRAYPAALRRLRDSARGGRT